MTFNEYNNGKDRTHPMTDDDTSIFSLALLIEIRPDKITDEQMNIVTDFVGEDFFIKVLENRIEVMKLPITFTIGAKLSILSFAKVIGHMIIILIDCLTKYYVDKPVVIDCQKLIELYPFGFYREEVVIDYVDNYLKPRKVKWAEIY